jgi:hypothetical protein
MPPSVVVFRQVERQSARIFGHVLPSRSRAAFSLRMQLS